MFSDDERMVCECYNIRVKDIKKAVENGCRTFEELEKATRIGVLCGACVKDAKRVVEELNKA